MADPVASRDWYVSVLHGRLVADQGKYQWIELGGQEVLLRPGRAADASAYRETQIAIVLCADSLDQVRMTLESRGVTVTNGDEDDCLTFQDPDGHWIQVTSQS